MSGRLRRATVFGSSFPGAGSPEWETAYRLGRCVGEHGLELVNGGYTGTMEASARGVREAGGRVIGVTVKTFTYAAPNPYLSRVIEVPDLFRRLSALIRLGDFYVVLPGGTGTLVELALVWEFLNKGVSSKPILAAASWREIGDLLPAGSPRGACVGPETIGAYLPQERLFFADDLPGTVAAFLDWCRGREI